MVDTIKIWSEALNSTTVLKVVVPEQVNIKKIILLLHGTMNPEMSTELLECLPQELALEKLCNEFGIAVVIPLMKNCYYISTKSYDCDRFVSQELPNWVRKNYYISDSAELILTGISMGGFGATLIGARTRAFRKIISVSGAYIAHDVEIGNPEVWGELMPNGKNFSSSFLHHFMPLENLGESVSRNALAALQLFHNDRIKIVATCGTKDWLYSRNLKFVEEMDKLRLNYKFYSLENGGHNSECFKNGLWKAVIYFEDSNNEI